EAGDRRYATVDVVARDISRIDHDRKCALRWRRFFDLADHADRLLSQCGSRISWRRRRLDPRVQGVAARLTAAGFQIDDGLRQYAIEIGSGLTHGAHVCT